MGASALDHLVVTAPTLEAGAAFVHANLGVWPLPGGEHDRMGTHNQLLRLGDALYLEVIAPNPAAPAPALARWFGLDALRPDALPRLATWVARTADIQAAASACGEALGSIEPMRRGDLNWLITLAPRGELIGGGAIPSLIQWQVPNHPAARLAPQGVELVELEIQQRNPERVRALLRAIEFDGPVKVTHSESQDKLVARLRTPAGIKTLETTAPRAA